MIDEVVSKSEIQRYVSAFYVANRHDQKVLAFHHFTYKSPGKAHHWNVPAPPEFILYLHNDG